MEAEEEEFRQEQLQHVQDMIRYVYGDRVIPTHLELASIGSEKFLKQLLYTMLPVVHSIGLNEQELFSVYSVLGGDQYTSADFVAPTPSAVLCAIQYIFDHFKEGKLERVHFHCLQHHIIALRNNVAKN